MSQSEIDELGLQDVQEKVAALMSSIELWVAKTNPKGDDVIALMATIMDCMIGALSLNGLVATGKVTISEEHHNIAKGRVKRFVVAAIEQVLKGVLPNADVASGAESQG